MNVTRYIEIHDMYKKRKKLLFLFTCKYKMSHKTAMDSSRIVPSPEDKYRSCPERHCIKIKKIIKQING